MLLHDLESQTRCLIIWHCSEPISSLSTLSPLGSSEVLWGWKREICHEDKTLSPRIYVPSQQAVIDVSQARACTFRRAYALFRALLGIYVWENPLLY